MIPALLLSLIVNASALDVKPTPAPEDNVYAAAVPEPSGAAFSLMALGALALRRRRRSTTGV